MSTTKKTSQEPSLIKWGLKWAASAGIAGIICCVAPAVLFRFGLREEFMLFHLQIFSTMKMVQLELLHGYYVV